MLVRNELENAAKALGDRVRDNTASGQDYYEMGCIMLRKKARADPSPPSDSPSIPTTGGVATDTHTHTHLPLPAPTQVYTQAIRNLQQAEAAWDGSDGDLAGLYNAMGALLLPRPPPERNPTQAPPTSFGRRTSIEQQVSITESNGAARASQASPSSPRARCRRRLTTIRRRSPSSLGALGSAGCWVAGAGWVGAGLGRMRRPLSSAALLAAGVSLRACESSSRSADTAPSSSRPRRSYVVALKNFGDTLEAEKRCAGAVGPLRRERAQPTAAGCFRLPCSFFLSLAVGVSPLSLLLSSAQVR